jgi:hypothetical protein
VPPQPKPLPHKLAANACWFPTIGPDTNNNTTAAITILLNVMVVFEFIDFFYLYGLYIIYKCVIYSTNVLQLLIT